MNKNYRVIIFLVAFIMALLLCYGGYYLINTHINKNVEISKSLKELPLPEVTGGERGKLGIDKNINELNIDEYLGRTDSVYRDMRMLEDPANYEAIGGDSYLSGYIKGFEIVPLPYLIPVDNLPEEVGKTYSGLTLFNKDANGNYVLNYEESMKIIEELFPKDKYIFLMCGGGGYAGMTKEFLVSLGWDKNKIYNVGGYWFYNGVNNVLVKKIVNGKVTYDFDNLPYHDINFNRLTKINKQVTLDDIYYNKINDEQFDIELDLNNVRDFNTDTEEGRIAAEKYWNETIQKKANIIDDLISNNASFVVIVQNTDEACGGEGVTLDRVAKSYLTSNKVYSYTINFTIFKETNLYDIVKYAPTVIVIEKGKIVAYIDLNKDAFDNDEEIQNWIDMHVNLNKEN